MTHKMRLDCLTDPDGAVSLCRAAAGLASGWAAHLVGLRVVEGLNPRPPIRGELPHSVHRTVADQRHRPGDRLRAIFDRQGADPASAERAGPERAVVGCRDTPEATRALHGLFPPLAPSPLSIVAVGDAPRLGAAGDRMTGPEPSLARHGLRIEIAGRTDGVASIPAPPEGKDRGLGAEMLSIGALVRSDLCDKILGAMSRALLRRTCPRVLCSW